MLLAETAARQMGAGVRQERWHVRTLRGLRPDRNPLRRTSDRVQTYLLAGLFVVAAALAPFAAQLASHGAYAAARSTERAQHASTHLVSAKLTEAARGTVTANGVSTEVAVQATWTSVSGAHRTGQVLAPAGAPDGGAVKVWTNADGDLASPPLQPSQVAGQAGVAAVGAIVGVGLLYLCGTVIIRHVLHRRRMAAWENDWAVTAPAWNPQSW